MHRQLGGLDNILGTHVLNIGFRGFRRGGGGLRRSCHDARDALAVTKDRHPVLRARALESQDVRLGVADVLEQLVSNGPYVVEPPAPQRLQADLAPGDGRGFGSAN